MIQQRDHILWHKLNGLLRYGLYKGGGKLFGDVVVNEYPKSGGSWPAQMLAEALDLPFPRNRLPMLRRSLLHGHYLSGTPIPNPVVVFRDGRDVAVSYYFHSIIGNDLVRQGALKGRRKALGITDPEDIATNLPRFIEHGFAGKTILRFTWAEFVARWYDAPDSVRVKYEDLHADPAGELHRIVQAVSGQDMPMERAEEIATAFSFRRQSGRQPGKEDSAKYLRKGIIGDWRNHFSPEAREVFNRVAGDALIQAGYEPDRRWVTADAAPAVAQ